MSAKVPAVVRLVKEALAEERCVVIGLQSTGEARTEEAITKYGVEMEDFISGPRELLLKLVEDNYPLPPKPDSFLQDEEKVTEVQRKRHYGPDVSSKGRVRKLAKMEDVSDDGMDGHSPLESDHESTDSGEEFYICQICNIEEVTFCVSINNTVLTSLWGHLKLRCSASLPIILFHHSPQLTC